MDGCLGYDGCAVQRMFHSPRAVQTRYLADFPRTMPGVCSEGQEESRGRAAAEDRAVLQHVLTALLRGPPDRPLRRASSPGAQGTAQDSSAAESRSLDPEGRPAEARGQLVRREIDAEGEGPGAARR